MLLQIILTFVILFFIWNIWAKRARQLLTTGESIGWTFFWMLACGVLWVPESTSRLADILGIGRGADVVLYFGMVILFYMVFRVYVRIEKIERDITKVVRKIALDEFQKDESPIPAAVRQSADRLGASTNHELREGEKRI